MSRTKLASEARKASRQIFASMPHEIRLATTLRFLSRLAYSTGDALTLGLMAIHAMARADVQGRLFETPMEEVQALVKRRGGSALNKLGQSLGTLLLKKGLQKYKNPAIQELVIQTVTDKLLSDNPIKRGMDVPQVVNFLTKMIWMEASTISRSKEFQTKRDMSMTHEDVDEFMSNPRNWARLPGTDLKRILDKIKRDPLMKDDKGNPRMLQFISGLAQGLSVRSIAQSMGFHDHAPLLKWVRDKGRMDRVKDYLEPLL